MQRLTHMTKLISMHINTVTTASVLKKRKQKLGGYR